MSDPQHDLLFETGTIIENKYRVESTLGTGSMGRVLLATDTILGRPVAIKVIHTEHMARRYAERLFFKEAQAMAQVRHPNVVQIYSFGYHSSYPYIVSEYVPGESLADVVSRSGALHPDVALGALEQSALGLDAVHQTGMVHRDVKPDNILISADYRCQLADFGLVKVQGERSGRRIGTPFYMSPEVAKEQSLPDGDAHLSDIYSLGVTAFVLLTGKFPFHDSNPEVLLAKQISEPPPIPSTVFPDLGRAFDEPILWAMSKDPYKRPRSGKEFVSALKAARKESAKPAQTNRKVLVVDDDPDMIAVYEIAFDAALGDHTLLTAADGLVALELTRAQLPRLLVVDLNMPRLNGSSFCKIVKSVPKLAKIPILVVSAALNEQNSAELKGLGVEATLSKPIQPRELIRLSKTLLLRAP